MSLRWLLRNQLKYINQFYNVTAISSNGQDLELVRKDQGVNIYAVEMTREITPILDIIAIIKLSRYLYKEKPFIVHTHTPKAGFIGMVASKIAQVPVRMHTVAGLPLMETSGIKWFILGLVEKITYRCAVYIYPNSFGLKEYIIQNKFCQPQKIKVLGSGSSNGIDTSYFSLTVQIEKEAEEIRRKNNISKEDFVFCYIGRIVKDKGINELLSAFNEIKGLERNVKLLLIGIFEEKLDPLSAESKDILERNKNIIYCGFQENVRAYLASCDALVFPSYREGFPNVPLQAGSMGLPSIVSDINGCNEIIKNGINGLIIQPKDAVSLKAAMLLLINDENLRKRLASNARKMIVERFDQQIIWDEILKEYRSMEVHYIQNKKNNRHFFYRKYIKKVLDYVLAVIVLLATIPIQLALAIVLAIRNSGDIFFVQLRPGYQGKPFRMFKFKTMTDKKDSSGHYLADEQRLTKLGKFLRSTSLDELPEIFNILKGEMSFVGPRPLLIQYMDRYTPEQMRRHNVKPGITGWAQINGRNAISWEEKFRLDLWYVDHQSFWIDLKILFLTIFRIIKREGINQPGHVTAEEFKGTL
jgi:lipopolysaccharide/colanic/teichoic acid biosynthesis glycosyltransferase/glycosyltransferase involved in cell wall biosynthesis